MFDDAVRATNAELLDGIAEVMRDLPGVQMEVHGETGDVKEHEAEALLGRLAKYYGKAAKADAALLCDLLAANRAKACVAALVARGVPEERFFVTFKSRTGKVETTFVPHPYDADERADLRMGVSPTVAEFTVSASPPQQEVSLELVRSTFDLTLRLHDKHVGSAHWSSCLAVPSGVPVAVYHEAAGDVPLRDDLVVYDGEQRVEGDDLFYIGERYTFVVPHTIRTVRTSAEHHVHPSAPLVQLAVERPVRRVQLDLLATSTARQDAQAKEAREKVLKYLEDNDVIFNGAVEEETQRAGAEQSWNIYHLDEAVMADNWRTIDGIVAILQEYPEIACEVHGSTTRANSAPQLLAEHFKLDRTNDVQEIKWTCSRATARRRASRRSSRAACTPRASRSPSRGARARRRSTSSRACRTRRASPRCSRAGCPSGCCTSASPTTA